jgi:hypothetical protein
MNSIFGQVAILVLMFIGLAMAGYVRNQNYNECLTKFSKQYCFTRT